MLGHIDPTILARLVELPWTSISDFNNPAVVDERSFELSFQTCKAEIPVDCSSLDSNRGCRARSLQKRGTPWGATSGLLESLTSMC